jgi:hypothetical protein
MDCQVEEHWPDPRAINTYSVWQTSERQSFVKLMASHDWSVQQQWGRCWPGVPFMVVPGGPGHHLPDTVLLFHATLNAVSE